MHIKDNPIEDIKEYINTELDRLERIAHRKLGKSTTQEYGERSGEINALVHVLEYIEGQFYN